MGGRKGISIVWRRDIAEGLIKIGLHSGDKLMMHSSLSSIGWVEGGAQTVVEAILEVIGPSGTLMVPAFSGLDQEVYDPLTSPSHTGMISEMVRRWPGAVRSLHPTHSVVVIGPDAQALVADHHHRIGVGKDTPLDRLAKAGGKILLLGVNHRVNSAIHIGEAYAEVPYWGYRRPERPSGKWLRLPSGEMVWVDLPQWPGCAFNFASIEPFLVQRGLLTYGHIGQARCQLMEAQAIIEAVVEYLSENPGRLLCHREGCTFCSQARKLIARSSVSHSRGRS